MSNPFTTKPKWKNGKWGEMPANAITPMPQVITKGNRETTVAAPPKNNGIVDIPVEEKPWKKYIIPIVIVIGSLAAVATVAIIIFVIRNRKNKKNQQNAGPSKKFTPGRQVGEQATPPANHVPHTYATQPQPTHVAHQPQQDEPNIEDQLHDVAQVAKTLGIDHENERKGRRSPTTKEVMEAYARRKRLEEGGETTADDDEETESSEGEEESHTPTPVPKKKSSRTMKDVAEGAKTRTKALAKTKSSKRNQRADRDERDENEEEGPPLNSPLPRLSYKEIDRLEIQPKKRLTAHKGKQKALPSKRRDSPEANEESHPDPRESEPEEPEEPVKQEKSSKKSRKKAHLTAAYLTTVLEQMKRDSEEGEEDDQDDEIGVVEEDDQAEEE